jgi:nucleotide-binding universal stress UspA family protein
MALQGPILVPLDGSDLAERAVPVAAHLARGAGADLRLLHVHVPITAEPIHVDGLPVIDERMHSLRREHEQAYLDGASHRLAPDVAVAAALLDGPVTTAITEYAQRNGAGLIVMATHGRGGLERAWLGSVADEMVRVSPIPLLLVPPEPGHVPGPFRRILVSLDGSALAEAILEHAVRLARVEPEAEMVLLDVLQPLASAAWVPPTAALHAENLRAREERARDYLESIGRRLEGAGLRVRSRVEVAANVASTILEIARGEGADVVALATHGRSGLVRLALGSVADKLVRGSRTPVLLFRPLPSRR